MDFDSKIPNRTYCDTLAEIRKVLNVIGPHNVDICKSVIAALVEECQVYGNRMEAGLFDKQDLLSWQEERKRLHTQIRKLRKEKELLGDRDADI